MSAPTAFLDTNILLRHLRGDVPEQAARATGLIRQIEAGERRVRIADTVVFETVFTLQRFYQHTPREIRDALLPLLELPGVVLAGKARLRRAFDLSVDQGISFADAYHVALMRDVGLTDLYTFDRQLDRIPGIRRLEPPESPAPAPAS